MGMLALARRLIGTLATYFRAHTLALHFLLGQGGLENLPGIQFHMVNQ